MKQFMNDDFLLSTQTAKILFDEGARNTPIFDWHCHLSPKEIYENKEPQDLCELWLSSDHYKWRAMRWYGIDENLITGGAPAFEKFKAYAETLSYAVGNPLYHWSHLELQRYFNITEPLSAKTAERIWENANSQIKAGGFTPRELIMKSNVRCVCTTDDPVDDLKYHKLLAAERDFTCKVLPAFRPDKALHPENDDFLMWIQKLGEAVGKDISSFAQLKEALSERIDYFNSLGCRASDQSLSYIAYRPTSDEKIEEIFSELLSGKKITAEQLEAYQTELLLFLGREYCRCNWAMELHLGALRNNNTRMFNKIGADAGFDSIDDPRLAHGLSRLLDALDRENSLPKTILFTLNPKDNAVLAAMTGNFQSSDVPGKVQFGSAWWFNDHLDGMREQMKSLSSCGVLGKFVGMVTDSRSFLSYPRHEYFRRILCGLLGEWVESGLYPDDTETLIEIVKNVSYYNAERYFNIGI